jgi:uncharacterized iron-regulated membrane protein
MKSFRKVIFWLHLTCGIAAGVVILVMSVTGLLLAWERQMTEAADVPAVSAPGSGRARLTVEELIPKAAAAKPGAALTELSLPRAEDVPVRASFGRAATLYIDPWTGEKLDALSPGTREFFRAVTGIHRWLGASEENRGIGKAVTGAGNLIFLFLVLSGLYLWWPRILKWSAFRPVMWFRRKLSGKARDWNWHNVLGFWSAIPLALIVASGVVISYPWASALVFRIAGETPPPPGPPPGANGPRSGNGNAARAGGAPPEAAAPADFTGLNAAFAAAQTTSSGWQTINLRLPAAKDAVFTVLDAPRGRPDLQSTVTVNRSTAAVVKREDLSSQSPGRRARTWLRWIHTGEAGGFWGQTLAAIVSASAIVLVWTGFALTWRRFSGRRRIPSGTPSV